MARGKLTPKREKFAQLYVKLGNATEAYRKAGYAVTNDRAAESASSRLLRTVEVQQRIAQLTERAAKRSDVTRERVIEELAKYAFRTADEENDADVEVKPRDSIKALELLGKRFGLWIERHSHEGPRWQEIFEQLPVEVQEQIVKALDEIRAPDASDGSGA